MAHLGKGDKLAEDKPDINHLDVGSFWQVVGDINEHGGQHQHCFKDIIQLTKMIGVNL